MSALDSLVTQSAMAFGSAHPNLTRELGWIFSLDARVGRMSTIQGTRKVGLPNDDCVTPAMSTALGILSTWQYTPGDAIPAHADMVMVASMRARKIVLAAIQRDRETCDATLRTSFDPTDASSDVLYYADRTAVAVTGDYSMDVAFSTRPDRCTITTQADRRETALRDAGLYGADSAILSAILSPEFTSGRSRVGDAAILRAAGLATGGRKSAENRAKIVATKRALRTAMREVVRHETADALRNRSYRRLNTRRSVQGYALVSAWETYANTYPLRESSGAVSGEVTTEQLMWVAPAKRAEQHAPNLSPLQVKIVAGGAIAVPSNLGVKVPNRRKGSAGQTGPTVPDNGSDAVETFVQIPSQAERRAELTRMTGALRK